MSQWRVVEGRIPLQDIAKSTGRSTGTVIQIAERNSIVTKNVKADGLNAGGIGLATIDTKDVDKLLEMIARTERRNRQKNGPVQRAVVRKAPAIKVAPVEAPAEDEGEETYQDFEAAARKMKRLADKYEVKEAHLVDGKWEISRSIVQTIEL